jgi:hypothetical protein
MAKCGRWNENCRSWGEFNDELHIPEYEMAASLWVESTEGCNGTPSKSKVAGVAMDIAHRARAKVEGDRRPYTVNKVPAQGWVRVKGWAQVPTVVVV